jgi:hypothetical protein
VEIGSSLPSFRDNLSVLSSRVMQPNRHFSWTAWPLTIGPIGCLETTATNYQSTLRNNPEEYRSHLRRGENLKLLVFNVTYRVILHSIANHTKSLYSPDLVYLAVLPQLYSIRHYNVSRLWTETKSKGNGCTQFVNTIPETFWMDYEKSGTRDKIFHSTSKYTTIFSRSDEFR